MSTVSTKPYLVRAIFDWCNDNGFTPHLAVAVGEGVLVPPEFVRDGEIVLNISPLATNRLEIGNDWVEFQARFGGIARDVRVPISAVRAIFARENGEGMGFAPEAPGAQTESGNDRPAGGEAGRELRAVPTAPVAEVPDVPKTEVHGEKRPERPHLTRIK